MFVNVLFIYFDNHQVFVCVWMRFSFLATCLLFSFFMFMWSSSFTSSPSLYLQSYVSNYYINTRNLCMCVIMRMGTSVYLYVCARMSVSMCARVNDCICICLCVHVFVSASMYECVCMHMYLSYVCECVYMHVPMFESASMYSSVLVSMHVCVCMCMFVCVSMCL